jgi:hypothetical protein
VAPELFLHILEVARRSLLANFPLATPSTLPYFDALSKFDEGFAEEIAEDSCREGDRIEAWIASKLANDRCAAIYLLSN